MHVIRSSTGDVRVCFLGRPLGPSSRAPADPAAIDLPQLGPGAPSRLCWNRQTHGARLVTAESGVVHEADALCSRERGLALVVYTADCVPVLLASHDEIVAIHAGWRGLAAGIVEQAARRVTGPGTIAWIGPCMAACCYEVSEEVAHSVALASGSSVIRTTLTRPRVDLPAAAAAQLQRGGIDEIRWCAECTGCSPDRWWSHRRARGQAQRNYALIWRPARSLTVTSAAATPT